MHCLAPLNFWEKMWCVEPEKTLKNKMKKKTKKKKKTKGTTNWTQDDLR